MSAYGKATGPIRFHFIGDEPAARQRIGEGRAFLGQVKEFMRLSEIKSYQAEAVLHDNATDKDIGVIRAKSNNNGLAAIDKVWITVPPKLPKKKGEKDVILGFVVRVHSESPDIKSYVFAKSEKDGAKEYLYAYTKSLSSYRELEDTIDGLLENTLEDKEKKDIAPYYFNNGFSAFFLYGDFDTAIDYSLNYADELPPYTYQLTVPDACLGEDFSGWGAAEYDSIVAMFHSIYDARVDEKVPVDSTHDYKAAPTISLRNKFKNIAISGAIPGIAASKIDCTYSTQDGFIAILPGNVDYTFSTEWIDKYKYDQTTTNRYTITTSDLGAYYTTTQGTNVGCVASIQGGWDPYPQTSFGAFVDGHQTADITYHEFTAKGEVINGWYTIQGNEGSVEITLIGKKATYKANRLFSGAYDKEILIAIGKEFNTIDEIIKVQDLTNIMWQ